MIVSTAPLLAALTLLILGTAIGMPAVIRLIRVHEAKHEWRQGSAGAIRTLAGWTLIVFWLMSIWFVATILGDWYVSGDLTAAIDRSFLRLRILVEIAAALGDN